MSYIHIDMPTASREYADRCRKTMHRLFEQGFFDLKSGSFTCNFDENGNLRSWEKKLNGNDKNPNTSLPSLPREAKIELQ